VSFKVVKRCTPWSADIADLGEPSRKAQTHRLFEGSHSRATGIEKQILDGLKGWIPQRRGLELLASSRALAARNSGFKKKWAVSGHSGRSAGCANRRKPLINQAMEEEGARWPHRSSNSMTAIPAGSVPSHLVNEFKGFWRPGGLERTGWDRVGRQFVSKVVSKNSVGGSMRWRERGAARRRCKSR
jgi:hypothetical protein